jgi:uncharacterized membrane protein YkoI
MRRRLILLVIAAVAVVLVAGAALAVGGGKGLIWDDNHYAKPGSLDDGKDLLPQTKIPLSQAVAAAQQAETGSLGQVDLEHYASRLVYTVDVGSHEVHVDATNGSIVGITPRD